MKNIIAPTDFSDAANRAADISTAIAERPGAEIHDLPLCIALVKPSWLKKKRSGFL